MTVIAALVLALGVSAGQAQDLRAEAERLAASGAYEEALKRFQALAAANPDDIPSRLWIGRLHLRMGQPRRAAAVFESIVAADEKNVEALSGLGTALVDAGDMERAADALDRAEAVAPERLDVLAAQGRRHAALGRATLALAYYGKALAADPGNVEIRRLSEALQASRAHRLTLGYNFQRFDPSIGDFNSGNVEVNARVNDAVRLFAAGELLRLGDDNETRGGGGVEWLAHPHVQFRVGAIGGGETRLPSLDAFVDAVVSQRRARWFVTVRYFDFEGADLWIAGPGVAVDVAPRLTLLARYLRGRTGFDAADSIGSDNAVLGVHARPTDRVAAFVEYRHGIDRLDWLTADRLTAGDANTIGIGASFSPTPFVTLGGAYDYQDRNDGSINRARARLTVRF